MNSGLVILNYNDAKTVIDLLETIKDYTVFKAIVLVDNNSTDESPIELQKAAVKYHCDFLETGENKGYAFGNNCGAKYLIEKYAVDYVYIANPDIRFEEEIIRKLNQVFAENPEYAVLSAVMLDRNGSVDKAPYRNIYSYTHDILDCFAIPRKIQKSKKMPIDYEKKVMPVDVIQGSFWAIRSEVLVKIGYLDENTFLYYEEMILGAKLKKAGLKTGIVTDTKYYHYHAVSISKSIKKVNGWKIHLNSKRYYEKVCNHISLFQKGILNICIWISIAEKYVIAFVSDLVRRH